MHNITIQLVDEDLWREFYPDTEMIVTRRGRVIFPKLDFRVFGLVPDALYAFQIHFERVDDKRYKFEKGVWEGSVIEEISKPEKIVRHTAGFKSGDEWMQSKPIQFARLKITNNINTTEPTHCILQTMCKFVPVITIIEMGPFNMLPEESSNRKEFRFDFTEFIAVTAYQNREITELKVQHNKYARGFRTAQMSRKRPASPVEQEPKRKSLSSSKSPPESIFSNPPKRVPWPAAPLYPSQYMNMHYNAEMANFYYQQDQLAAYQQAYQAGEQQMAYNYWPMMTPNFPPNFSGGRQSPDSSGYCRSTSP